MNHDIFGKLLDELDGNSVETLKAKNAKYAKGSDDCLHNFKEGAEITGRTTAQTCWGYASKHIVALRDMIERNDFSDREDFLEKCQDTINYIRFLWCIGNEEAGVILESKDEPQAIVVVDMKTDKIHRVYPSSVNPTVEVDEKSGEFKVHYDDKNIGERCTWIYFDNEYAYKFMKEGMIDYEK